ncbi:hypothetical protein Tco_1303417 [Tanacetum coccineum]
MEDEELSTIPEKESDEFIKSSVKDIIPIPRESEDTSGSDRGVIDEINAFLDMDISTDIENGYHESEGITLVLRVYFILKTLPYLPSEVTDIRKRTNNEAKRTKPSTRMERMQEIKAEVIGGLDVASNQGSRSIAWRIIKIEGPGMVDDERPRVLDPSPHPYIRRPPHSLLSGLVLAYF